ncbi:MAG: RnfH family protein [Gammaproteobacteria bacterium]
MGDSTDGAAGSIPVGLIPIEVAFARPDRQRLIELDVPLGTPVRKALELSGIAAVFDEIDIATCPVGIFGRAIEDDHVLQAGDRLEIYRPLTVNPRDARRARARNRG